MLLGATSGQGGGQVVANALAPYAANLIGDKFDAKHGSDPNAALQLLSHALLGALLAEVNGGNAGGGAAAAAGGELAAKLLTEALYPGYTGELNDQQKQTILALSQAVAAVAGSSAGDGLAGTALAAGIAKNSVENNYLDAKQLLALAEERKECNGNEACESAASERWAKVSKLQGKEMLATCQQADGACDLQFAQAWAYGKTDASQLGLGLDQAASKELVMRFLETAAGKPYRGGTGSFFMQMGMGAVDPASELVTGALGYALALGDIALAPQYHRDPVTVEFKYERMIVGTPIFGDTSGNPIEAGRYKLGNLAGLDLALLGAAWRSGKVASDINLRNAGGLADEAAGSIRDVNPGYPNFGRTHNCVNCSIATDSTLAGNPASALPINHTNGVPLSVLEKQYGSKFGPITQPDDIVQQMLRSGTGSRGIIYGSYGPGQTGHVFNVVNQNGVIRFLDGQTGKAADLSKFKTLHLLKTR
ncbi:MULTISPECIES: toxin glutamine deamidase domain-containing protein [Stenotrophomonas]|uniref:toxin glutamine deamidase domain-containing protein n=1 Tax=Stenotrophomonas TaxID=40323 RepID=UPI00217DF54D|nr:MULTISPECIES: toxin glutamine deamidase domain-containing protein [Stenotrophomonas]